VPAYFGDAFFIFLLRQFFMSIPHEMDEAARIDGASHLAIFGRIILPLARPALAVVALLTFLGSWTDLFGPLIYLSDSSTFTLSLGLLQYQSLHAIRWGQLMAASVMFIMPIIVLFLVTQKTFIQGITMTGLKG
jgi:multiple sugar transport system permease protein